MAAFDDQHDDAQVDVSQFEPELDSISKGARVPALHGLEVSDVEPDVVKAGSRRYGGWGPATDDRGLRVRGGPWR
jgi:hypothetical protein